MQEVQKLHDDDFLDPIRMRYINLVKSFYLLYLLLDGLVLVLQAKFGQLILVL